MRPHRTSPSLSLLLLLPLLLTLFRPLLSPTAPTAVSAASNVNFAGATGHWLTAMSNITQSPCFNSTSLVFTYPNPLYPAAPPIILDSANWDSHYLHTWIAKILIEELLGYAVLINDAYTDPSATSLQRMSGGEVTANVEWWPSSDGAYTQYVTTARTVRDEGGLGVIGQLGLYLTKWTVRYYATMMLEYYRWYKSDPLLAVPIFNSSWAYLTNPLTGLDMRMNASGELVCPDNATLHALNLTLPFPYGCTNGLFIPPQCSFPNMTTACLVTFHPDPFLDSGSVPALIISQKLPFVVAYISDYQPYLAYLAQVVHAPIIFFSQSPDPFLDLYCTNPTTSSNASSVCFQRMLFASSDPSCDGETPGTSRTCDWPQLGLTKVAQASVMRNLTRVNTLITSMALKTADDKSMFVQLEGSYPITGPKDYKAVACQWIHNNTAVWSSWIAPPFACGVADMYYTVGQCSEQTTMAVTWAYGYPKACQGGMTLPQGESVPCDVVPTSSRLYQAVVVVSCAVLALPLLVAASQAYALLRLDRPTLMVQQLSGAWLLLFTLGLLLLSLTPLISVSALTESVCRARVFLCVLGFSLSLLALSCMSEQLLKLMSSLLATNHPRLDAAKVLGTLLVNLVLLTLAPPLTSAQSLLSTYTITTPAGATIEELYCEQPPLGSSLLLVLLNGLLVLRCVERLVRSVVQLRMSGRLYKDRPMAKLGHTMQIHSLAWTLLVLVAAATLLYYYTAPASGNLNNSDSVKFISATLLCSVPVCLGCFFAPSLHLYRVIRQRKREKARKKAMEAETSKSHASKSESEKGLELATLAGTLSDPLALLLFQQYAQSSLEGENIAFLLGIQAYVGLLKKEPTTVQEVLDGAKEMYLTYVAEGAESQINISAKQKGELEADMKKLIHHVDSAKKGGANANANANADVSGSLIKAALQKSGSSGSSGGSSGMPGQVGDSNGEVEGGGGDGHYPTVSEEGGKGGGEGTYSFDFLKSVPSSSRDSMSRSLAADTTVGRPTISVSSVGLTSSPSALPKPSVARLSTPAAWAASSPLQSVASRELRNRAKAVFDCAVKEVFSLLTVNAWPRFLQSKQAQRANELLGWCGAFDAYTDREQLGIINKLRKMRAVSSQKRNSFTAPDGFLEHTHLSAGGASSMHDKEESAAALQPGNHDPSSTVGPLMSPSSRPYTGDSHASLAPRSRKSSLQLSVPPGRSSVVHPAPAGGEEGGGGEPLRSPSVGGSTSTSQGMGAPIATLTGDSVEGGGTISVALMVRPSVTGRGSLNGGVPSRRNSTGLMSSAPSIAIKALLADEAIDDDKSIDSDKRED